MSKAPAAPLQPRWDAKYRVFWCGDKVVKQFKGDAGNQVPVLEAFEIEGWPEMIDDPLPYDPGQHPKKPPR